MSKLFEGYEEGLPFGPAAGAINGLNEEEIKAKIIDVLRSPAEATTWGSTTWHGGPGNEGTTYYHNQMTGQTANSMGLPNIGHEKAKRLQRKMQSYADAVNKPLIPSFSPGQGEDPLEVLPAMAYGFAESGAKILEVNYSCPNKVIEGVRLEPVLCHDLEMMAEIDERITKEIGPDVLLIRKLAPLVGEKRSLIPQTAEMFARAGGNVALNLYNTIGAQSILTEHGDPALTVAENKGGLSGPALIEVGRDGVRDFRPRLPENVGLISCLGVFRGSEIFQRVDVLGADLTEGVTVLWEGERQGRSFGQTIERLATEYIQYRDYDVVAS